MATSSETVARHTNTSFGQWPFMITKENDLESILQGAFKSYLSCPSRFHHHLLFVGPRQPSAVSASLVVS